VYEKEVVMKRILFVVVAARALGAAVVAPSGAKEKRLLEVIQLPVGFQPEGIAAGRGSTFFVGSIPTGAVFRGSFVSGTGSVLVPGRAGRAAIGVEFDHREDRLFVAGGPTGKAFVYDASSGEDIATLELTASTTFVNDVVVTRRAAWFTDSLNPVLYRVPIAKNGSLGTPETVPLTGAIVYQAGFNVNGIDAARHGSVLVIVQSNTGKLFTVDPDSGSTREIDLGGADVMGGDGLLLRRDKLFVVQNMLNRIAVVKLERGFEAGEVVRHLTDSDLAVPTTIAEFAGRLWAVNARFGVTSPATTAYQVVQVRIDGKSRGSEDDEESRAPEDDDTDDSDDDDSDAADEHEEADD
jgi:hypothetical protein